MKLYVILFFCAASMAILTGNYGLKMFGPNTVTTSEIESIQKIKKAFQASGISSQVLNLSSLYSGAERFQLLNPSYPLADFRETKKDIFFGRGDCFKYFSNITNQKEDEKSFLWEEYRCFKKESLPLDFFERPPFLHPSGYSYTYLAFKLKGKDFYNVVWAKEHQPLFHIQELKEIKNYLGKLSFPYNFLEQLGAEEISTLSKGWPGFITQDYVVWRSSYKTVYSDLYYRIYDRKDLDRFLKKTPYVLVSSTLRKRCLVQEDKICWAHNTGHLSRLAGESGISFFFGSIFLMTIVLAILLNKIKQQKKEDERQRLALQVLTHEFRTPVASILVILESLNNQFEKYDSDTQDNILRLSAEGHRLNRLVQTTKNYLRLQKGNNIIENRWVKINSINEFILDQVEQTGGDFIFNPLLKDEEFILDPYWTGICLKNILENALSHGSEKRQVFLKYIPGQLDIIVQDEGVCSFKTLEEMSSPFIRGPKSSGTGLGLNIVRSVLRDLGGELLFESSPTRFTLRLKNKKRLAKES